MSRTLETSRAKKHTRPQHAADVDRLRERVEDLEDLRDLKEAVKQNGDKRLIPFAKVKRTSISVESPPLVRQWLKDCDF